MYLCAGGLPIIEPQKKSALRLKRFSWSVLSFGWLEKRTDNKKIACSVLIAVSQSIGDLHNIIGNTHTHRNTYIHYYKLPSKIALLTVALEIYFGCKVATNLRDIKVITTPTNTI